MKIALGSDHGGFRVKEVVRRALRDRGVEVEDVGCYGTDSTDYPDFAREVAVRVSEESVDQGVLVCTTGLGMDMTANKFPRVRAALCSDPAVVRMAREHNDANVLVLPGRALSDADVETIVAEWLKNGFSEVERHKRRVGKMAGLHHPAISMSAVFERDPEVYAAISDEMIRQQETINLIASENLVSPAVRQAQGCVMTNKYAEGYPGKRWYNGCRFVDTVEQLAIDRACALFAAEHANVQPHCGSSANMAVYSSMLNPGETVLAMSLAHGGHLTHGSPANFSGRSFNFVGYGVSATTERIDFDEVSRLATEHRPKLIVVGASSYPRTLDFARFRDIADAVGARLMVDMAHIAGLVAAECHPSPVPFADYVTTTTHKTLRGPRGGMILCRREFAAAMDKQIFPGTQGGPLMQAIAAKAVSLHEAMQPEFKSYGVRIVRNAKAMAERFTEKGLRLVSGGTDNHLMLVDVTGFGLTGRDAATALEPAGIVVNKNSIPFDSRGPAVTSGIRIGTPTITTRGMGEDECRLVADLIVKVLRSPDDPEVRAAVSGAVAELTVQFPVP